MIPLLGHAVHFPFRFQPMFDIVALGPTAFLVQRVGALGNPSTSAFFSIFLERLRSANVGGGVGVTRHASIVGWGARPSGAGCLRHRRPSLGATSSSGVNRRIRLDSFLNNVTRRGPFRLFACFVVCSLGSWLLF